MLHILKGGGETKAHPNKSSSKYRPDVNDLVKYYRSKGIVGEESVYILATIGLLAGNSFCIEGRSGTGKTKIADALMDLLPPKSVYSFDASSDKSLIRDAERLNKARVLYVPEMQNVFNSRYQTLVEVLKCLCAEKDFTYSGVAGGKSYEFRIRGDITFYTTLATENDFKPRIEYTRRMFQLFTRLGEDVQERIIREKARARYLPKADLDEISAQELRALKVHASSLLYMPQIRVVNVFSDYIEGIIPRENTMVAAFIDKYFDLNEASGKFHYPLRILRKINGNPILFLNIDDIVLIHSHYPPHFCRSLSNLDREHAYEEDTVLRFQEDVDWQQCLDIGMEIMRKYYPSVFDEWSSLQRLEGYIPQDQEQENGLSFDEWSTHFGVNPDQKLTPNQSDQRCQFRIRINPEKPDN